ncbi:hypothetical protein BDQ17DRAFT_1339093 [Cyathus striatus]|nr:hypothetical protein BDQ17DRAFT_1339093 [Cyathus striatus]
MKLRPRSKRASSNINVLEDLSDVEGYNSNINHGTAEEYESMTNREVKPKETNLPPAKRAKTSLSSNALKLTSKQLADIFKIVPMDIWFEIFSWISPKDLITLTRTTKVIRETLMTKGAITVWKTARERFGVPACPEDFSEPQWVALLFDGTRCQSCNAEGNLNVDFGLRRRVYTQCRKANLVVESRFNKYFLDYDKSILELIPYTNSSAPGRVSKSRYYWKNDIKDTIKEVEKYIYMIRMSSPGAIQEYQDFSWKSAVERERKELIEEGADRTREQIFQRFKHMGYIQIMCTVGEVTDLVWAHLVKTPEPKVRQAKSSRLVIERKQLINLRMNALASAYKAYMTAHVSPRHWKLYPSLGELRQHATFSYLINSTSDNMMEIAASFSEALYLFPMLKDQYSAEKKTKILAKFKEGISSTSPLDDLIKLNGDEPTDKHLDLSLPRYRHGLQLLKSPSLVGKMREFTMAVKVHI